jgi:hypothetical protein
MQQPSTSIRKSRRLTFIAIGIGLAPNLFVLLTGLQFFFVSPGSHIRPMGWAAMIYGLSLLAGLIAIPFSLIATFVDRSPLPLVGAALSVFPFIFGRWLLHFAADTIGFTLAS